MKGALLALAVALPVAAAAAAPDVSPRPEARPGAEAAIRAALPAELLPDMRPIPRPAGAIRAFAAVPLVPNLAVSPRPLARPGAIVQKAMARRSARLRGAVCGDPDLQGDVVGHVPGRIAACGIDEAVRLRSVAGVALSQPALMDCTTAAALKRWVERGARPALKGHGRLAQLRVPAHYACRTRNNQPGAKVSEHGKGKAIDISGFQLENGQVISVLQGWRDRRFGTALRQMHRAACGTFGTVLGPESDRFHQDHFHLDTARHGNGPYCR